MLCVLKNIIFAGMKQILKYLLMSLLAILIFYGGAGVNLISYCCTDCVKAGVEALVSESCCIIHNHNHNHDKAVADTEEHDFSFNNVHNCGIERVEFEWTAEENARTLVISPLITDVLFSTVTSPLLAGPQSASSFTVTGGDPPLALPPRDYLSLLTTLLI